MAKKKANPYHVGRPNPGPAHPPVPKAPAGLPLSPTVPAMTTPLMPANLQKRVVELVDSRSPAFEDRSGPL
jgi:hypothetical protein